MTDPQRLIDEAQAAMQAGGAETYRKVAWRLLRWSWGVLSLQDREGFLGGLDNDRREFHPEMARAARDCAARASIASDLRSVIGSLEDGSKGAALSLVSSWSKWTDKQHALALSLIKEARRPVGSQKEVVE